MRRTMSALEARLNRIKSILNLDAEKQLVAAVCWVFHCSHVGFKNVHQLQQQLVYVAHLKPPRCRNDLKNATKNAKHHPRGSLPA